MLGDACRDSATTRVALDEIHRLFEENLHENSPGVTERIQLVLTALSETNEHIKLAAKKELLKVIGVLVTVLGPRFRDYSHKILNLFLKKIRDSCHITELFTSIGDSFGSVVKYGLGQLQLAQSLEVFTEFLNFFSNALTKEG